MKFCSQCGKELPEDAMFCPSCGCSVKNGGNYSQHNGNNYGNEQRYTMPEYLDNYSAISIIGLVFSFLSPLIGLIISIVASGEAERAGSLKSRSLARTGIIISAVLLGLIAFIVLIAIIVVISSVAWIV